MKRFENYESQKIRRFGQNNEPKKTKKFGFRKKTDFFRLKCKFRNKNVAQKLRTIIQIFFQQKNYFFRAFVLFSSIYGTNTFFAILYNVCIKVY